MTKELKKKIEAILYTTGKFTSLEEIAKLCGFGSTSLVHQAIKELQQEYENKETSITLEQKNNKFKLNIKKEYQHLTSKLVSELEFNMPVQKTLAIIAFKQPVHQAQVIKIRGNKAYDHIKLLKDEGFLISEKSGRTRLLKLTPQFYDYFDVVEDQLKQQFEDIVKEEKDSEKEQYTPEV